MNYLNLLFKKKKIQFAFVVAFAYLLYCQVPACPVVLNRSCVCAVTHRVQREGDRDFKQVISSASGTVLEHGRIGFPAFQHVI